MSLKQTQDYFDKNASSWSNHYKQSRLFKKRYLVFQQAVKRYGSGSRKALDYGAGSGVLTEILINSFESVVATDLSEKMMEVAREKYKDCPNVKIVEIHKLQQASFDFLICSSVIEYAKDPNQFLATLSSYVRPGGIMLITFPNKLGPLQLINRYILAPLRGDSYTNFQHHLHSSHSILDLAKKHNLQCLDISTPIGIPIMTSLGLGELYFLVVKKTS